MHPPRLGVPNPLVLTAVDRPRTAVLAGFRRASSRRLLSGRRSPRVNLHVRGSKLARTRIFGSSPVPCRKWKPAIVRKLLLRVSAHSELVAAVSGKRVFSWWRQEPEPGHCHDVVTTRREPVVQSETPWHGFSWSKALQIYCGTAKFDLCPTGGQVVAGSNPVSPTAAQRLFLAFEIRLPGRFDPNV